MFVERKLNPATRETWGGVALDSTPTPCSESAHIPAVLAAGVFAARGTNPGTRRTCGLVSPDTDSAIVGEAGDNIGRGRPQLDFLYRRTRALRAAGADRRLARFEHRLPNRRSSVKRDGELVRG